ncbi:MAG TPA: hypothetical protein VGF55_19415 [Gemmataceae bacterium]
MSLARSTGVVVLAVFAAGGARAETYPLGEAPQANECFAVHLTLKLAGEMTVVQEGKPIKLKLTSQAEHQYRERVLAVQKDGPLATKAARYYDDARVAHSVDGATSHRTLRPDRRLAVAQRPQDALLCYSPQGPLTREEVETVSEHFDTLALAGLLPGKDVAVGDTWKLGNATTQTLCLFDGLVENDLTGKLTGVKDGVAEVAVTGTARGIDLGAQVKVAVTATAKFDLAQKRLTALEWKQKDDRDQGPASPASTAEATWTVTRRPIEEPRDLCDVALAGVPAGFDVPQPLTQVSIRDVKGRFDLTAGRDWQVVSQTDARLVLRLLDRGDFVAQATITPWPKADPGQHADVKEFREQMLGSPGWQAEDVLQEGDLPNQSAGRYVYRLTARGDMDGVKVVQCFYLVAGPKGEQVVVAFTLKLTQVAKLGARDMILVDGLELAK